MKAPKGQDLPVLYLDFDGVLHHEDVHWHPKRGAFMRPAGFTLFEHAHLLNDWLRPYPEVRIVLSTSWVLRYGCYTSAKRLPSELRERVIGATFHSRMATADEMGRRSWFDPRNSALEARFREKPRGVQIAEDVLRRNPRAWLALDDDGEGWPLDQLDGLVLTDKEHGISAPGTEARVAAHLHRLAQPRPY